MWVRLQEFWSLATNLDYFWKLTYLSAVLCLKQKLQNLSSWPCDEAAKAWIRPHQSLPPCWTPVNSHIFSGRGACFPFSVDVLWSASVSNKCLQLPTKQLSSSTAASATSFHHEVFLAATASLQQRVLRAWETCRGTADPGGVKQDTEWAILISSWFLRYSYFHQERIKGQLNEGLLHLGSVAHFWKWSQAVALRLDVRPDGLKGKKQHWFWGF